MSSGFNQHIVAYTKVIGKPEVAGSAVPFDDVYFVYLVDMLKNMLICASFEPQVPKLVSKHDRFAAQDRTLLAFFKSRTPLSVHFGIPWPLFGGTSRKIYRHLIQHRQTVTTYGRVAEAVFGNQSYARVVASATAHNFLPVFIPCHLVKSASGGEEAYSALGSKNRGDIKNKLILCETLLQA